MTKRNLGRFELNAEQVKHEPELIAKAFSILSLVPVRCEYLFHSDVLEYIAISDRFPEIERGMIAPRYDIKITKETDGTVLVEVTPV